MGAEHWGQQDYSEAAWDILECLTEAKVPIPTTHIGRMDLIASQGRRRLLAIWTFAPLPRFRDTRRRRGLSC